MGLRHGLRPQPQRHGKEADGGSAAFAANQAGSTKLPSLNRRMLFVESSNLFDGSAIDLRLITLYCRITSLTVWLRAERNERLVMSYLSSRSLPCTGIDGTKAIIVFEASKLRKMPPVKNSAFDVLSKSSIRELNPVGLWLALSLSLSGPRFRFRASSGLSLLSLPVLAALVPGWRLAIEKKQSRSRVRLRVDRRRTRASEGKDDGRIDSEECCGVQFAR